MSLVTDDVRVGETLIRLEHVYKVYRVADTGVAALGGVTFDVARGEFVAGGGPRGSGEASILKPIGGPGPAAPRSRAGGGGDPRPPPPGGGARGPPDPA